MTKFFLTLAVAAVATVDAFYIPGWSIKSYADMDKVPLYVNKVTSNHSPLPYSYFQLPFVCQPSKGMSSVTLNLGEVLSGDRIWESDYNLIMNNETTCADLCTKKVDMAGLKRADELIRNQYTVEWIVDNLPGATAFISVVNKKRYYAAGFPLGGISDDKAFINNHVIILVRYRQAPRNPNHNVIVAFEVYPKSVSSDSLKCPGTTNTYEPFFIDPTKESDEIPFTYSVYWKHDDTISWESRWNMYLSNSDDSAKVHWFALVNSLVIAAFLAILVAVILIRTLARDIQSYNQQATQNLDSNAEEQDKDLMDEVSGWKLVHADVFRAPKLSVVFASVIGSGIQFLVMTAIVVGFACMGVLNPSFRGGLLSYALFLFAFAGFFSGYVSSRINRNMGGENWGKCAIYTAILVPGLLMGVFVLLNFFVWYKASSSAIPFSTLLALICIWIFISCPLVVIGSYVGSRVTPTTVPTRVSVIPRQIPSQRRYKGLIPSVLLGGLLPFLVIFVELRFVYNSVWQTKSIYYYMYGFFALVFFVLQITVMEMSIVITYFQLNTEDYRWWWKSFLVGTGSAWWILIYSVFYYFTTLELQGFVPMLMFFGYSLMGTFIYGLITGTIGFLASYFFVLRIYSAIKAD